MGILARIFSHIGSGASSDKYYKSMNQALAILNEDFTMLHYPYHIKDGESFFEAQKNLTDYCMSLLPSVKGKTILEVGCGNGIQAQYINKKYKPRSLIAVDINRANIDIAREEAYKKGLENIVFHIDDAQNLSNIADNSIDYVINIESAFHYPDKPSFFREIARVLKPGGLYLIADILTDPRRRIAPGRYWKRRMHLNHWSRNKYEQEIPRADLMILSYNDITTSIIKSFLNYRRWLASMRKKHIIDDIMLKLYYTIHVRLNIYLLRTRRQYVVITGARAR